MQTTGPDRDIDDAKESLVARIEELGRRFQDARKKFDIQRHIVAHPLLAVGAAFAGGALLGLIGGGGGGGGGSSQSGKRSVVATAIGTLALAGIRELATHQLRKWLGDPETSSPDPVESFLEH